MPSITQHRDDSFVKLMLIGDSGSGKTGALASLVPCGYKLRILDLENKLDILASYLTDEQSIYHQRLNGTDLANAVQYSIITEPMKIMQNRVVPSKGNVWERTVNMLTTWKEKLPDGSEINLGKPAEWGHDTILVIDSFSALAEAALYNVQRFNGRLGADPVGNNWRRDVGVAQQMLERILVMIAEEDFCCHVIITAHIRYLHERDGRFVNLDEENKDDPSIETKGYPMAIGGALSPRVPRRFNNMLQTEVSGTGSAARREIFTVPQMGVALKSSAPLRVKPRYKLETGLAEFFRDVRGTEPIPQNWAQPK